MANFIGRANVIKGQSRGGRFLAPQSILSDVRDGDATLIVRPENLALAQDDRPGWAGSIGFATAFGPTIEYEIDCGFAEPLRAIVTREAGRGTIPPGTRVCASIADTGSAIVLAGSVGHEP